MSLLRSIFPLKRRSPALDSASEFIASDFLNDALLFLAKTGEAEMKDFGIDRLFTCTRKGVKIDAWAPGNLFSARILKSADGEPDEWETVLSYGQWTRRGPWEAHVASVIHELEAIGKERQGIEFRNMKESASRYAMVKEA